jgi:hypothetical protein
MRDIVQQHLIKKAKGLTRDALCAYIQEKELVPKALLQKKQKPVLMSTSTSKQPPRGYVAYDGRNSCYIDSFFTCFIISNPKWFKQHICHGQLGAFITSDLTSAAQRIRSELCVLYKHLVSKKPTTSYKCRSLRLLFHKFDKLYKPQYPTEWLGEQNDPNEVIELLSRVFTLPNTIASRPAGSLPFSGITVHAKKGTNVKIGDYVPITKEWVEDIQRHRTITYLSADYLYIGVLRNLDGDDNTKTTSPVLPDTKINLPENPKPLHLKAIIIHNGSSPQSGHYTGIVRMKGGWFYYDDLKGSYKFIGRSTKVVMKDEYLQNCAGFFYA